MNKRRIILSLIALDVAENGKLTRQGLRLYIENRISWGAIQPAIEAGLTIYNRKQQEAPNL